MILLFKYYSCFNLCQFWFCEHTDIIQPVSDYKCFPRFLKWDLTILANKLDKIDLDNLGKYVVIFFAGICFW